VGGNAGSGRPRRIFLDQSCRSFRDGPGQEYSKPPSVYEVFDDSGTSKRCVGVRIVASGSKGKRA
jgi:hypothetical protein